MPLNRIISTLFGRRHTYIPTVEIEFLDTSRQRFRVVKVWNRQGAMTLLEPAPEFEWGNNHEGYNAIALLLSRRLHEPVEQVTFHINEL